MVNICGQSTLSKGDYPCYCGWASFNQLKGLMSKIKISLGEKKFFLKTTELDPQILPKGFSFSRRRSEKIIMIYVKLRPLVVFSQNIYWVDQGFVTSDGKNQMNLWPTQQFGFLIIVHLHHFYGDNRKINGKAGFVTTYMTLTSHLTSQASGFSIIE